ncbi:MAG TPA: glycosyltransferase family 39 protein, partial [Pseudonocardiaceae bacterium]|nr:glycosyltransferase family 39 protein [Pseudonocardiaceae bacterium]
VRRLAGESAALVAALVLAVSPAVIALNRGNISDTLMILLVVLAADAASAAVLTASQGRLVLAGIWVGLAFQAKTMEAWLVLPALGIAYLVAAPGPLPRRVRHVAVGGVVAAVVSLLWVVVVTLVPASARPYVDGSQHNSLFEQVFLYNGFGRFGADNPLRVLGVQGMRLTDAEAPPGWDRLLTGELGRDVGWLLPLALVIAITGFLARRARPRTDPLRAGYLLWGLWMLTLAAVFSVSSEIHAYYTAALAPVIAALCGLGVTQAWTSRDTARVWVLIAVLVTGTAFYAGVMLRSSAPAPPGWLLPALAAVTVLAVALSLICAARRPSARTRLGALGVAGLAVLLVPTVAGALLAAGGRGPFDTPFEPARTAARIDEGFITIPELIKQAVPELEHMRAGAPDLLATQSAGVAGFFSYASGQEVLPIGGFTGTMPFPTLDELRRDIARGDFHLVLAISTRDPRLAWIAQHCEHLPRSMSPLESYYCVPADAWLPG